MGKNINVDLIEFFIKEEVRKIAKPIFWATETRMAKSLLIKHPLNFYLTMGNLEGKLNSLRFLGSDSGQIRIGKQQVANATSIEYTKPNVEDFLNKYK